MNTYLDLLDSSTIFELLVRLHYQDLIAICKIYCSLYKITTTSFFQEEWKTYNIRTVTWQKDESTYISMELDRTNLRHGTYREYIENGIVLLETNYIQDYKHGSEVKWNNDEENKLRSVESFRNGQLHGKCIYYGEDGNIQELSYVNGISDGVHRDIMADGMIKISQTKGGIPHGKWIQFHSNGVIAHVTYYGRPEYTATSWFDNARKQREFTYANNTMHGYYRTWDINGELELDLRYNNGQTY